MPWLQANDDCQDGVEAMRRVMEVRRKRGQMIRQRSILVHPREPAEAPPEPEKKPPIFVRPNRVPEGKLINFMDFKSGPETYVPSEDEPFIGVNSIMYATCTYFNISKLQILSDSRVKHLVLSRHTAFYLCRKLTRLSYPEIGRRFRKDHTSILHGVRRIQYELDLGENPYICDAVAEIERRVLAL